MPRLQDRGFFMDNIRPSLGTGSPLLGGASPMLNAMQGGGGVQGIGTQVTPSSAIYQPGIQVPAPSTIPNPNGSPMNHFAFQGSMGTPPVSPQQQPPAPQAPQPPKAETASIIEALTKRLHDLSKLEHSIHGVQ